MTTYYRILNTTKQEYIIFLHLPVATRGEIISNPIATALVAYYLLYNSGDTITSLTEYDDGPEHFEIYREVTDETIDKMIDDKILIDEGREYIDEDKDIYFRKLALTDIEWNFKPF